MTTIPNAEVNKYFIDLHRALAQTEFRISVAKLLGTRVGDDVNTWQDIEKSTLPIYTKAMRSNRYAVTTAAEECIAEYEKIKSRFYDAFDTVAINGNAEPATLAQGWYGLMKYVDNVMAVWVGYINQQPVNSGENVPKKIDNTLRGILTFTCSQGNSLYIDEGEAKDELVSKIASYLGAKPSGLRIFHAYSALKRLGYLSQPDAKPVIDKMRTEFGFTNKRSGITKYQEAKHNHLVDDKELEAAISAFKVR